MRRMPEPGPDDMHANMQSVTDPACALDGLRITLVGPAPPPAGGMSYQTEQLARLLASEGALVDWVHTNAAYRPAWVGRVRGLRAIFRLVPHVLRLIRSTARADVVHVMANSGWSWFLLASPAVIVSRAARRPVVVNYRGGEARRFLARFGWFARPLLRLAHRIAVPSPFLQHVFAEHHIDSVIVPNVIDLERFPYSPPAAEVPRNPHVVAIRNLEAIYGNDTVLRAFALVQEQFKGARLSIAGSGPERSQLEVLTSTLGVAGQVGFTGPLDRDGMAELLASADLVVNASRADNMPNALLEAMATGTPVVTTDAGGIPFIVEHEHTALLCPVDDHRALAQAAIRLLSDRTLAITLARTARADMERYEWRRVRGQWAACYHTAGAERAAT